MNTARVTRPRLLPLSERHYMTAKEVGQAIAGGAALPDRYECVERAAEKTARKLTPGAFARLLLDDQNDRRNWLDMIADTYGGRFEWNGVSVLWYPDEDTATGMEKTA